MNQSALSLSLVFKPLRTIGWLIGLVLPGPGDGPSSGDNCEWCSVQDMSRSYVADKDKRVVSHYITQVFISYYQYCNTDLERLHGRTHF